MVQHITNNLQELSDLLFKMSKSQYIKKLDILTQASIGQHVRHIIEFYQCLIDVEQTNQLNYDIRKRDLKLETDIDFACTTIASLINSLSSCKQDFPISLVVDYSSNEKDPMIVQTTLYRELAYNFEHSIHHQALIKVAITEMNLTTLIADSFGYAPSTIRHLNKCVQ